MLDGAQDLTSTRPASPNTPLSKYITTRATRRPDSPASAQRPSVSLGLRGRPSGCGGLSPPRMAPSATRDCRVVPEEQDVEPRAIEQAAERARVTARTLPRTRGLPASARYLASLRVISGSTSRHESRTTRPTRTVLDPVRTPCRSGATSELPPVDLQVPHELRLRVEHGRPAFRGGPDKADPAGRCALTGVFDAEDCASEAGLIESTTDGCGA